MLFEEKYTKSNKAEFLAKVQEVSDRLVISPDWLMAVMWKESRISASARNSSTGAIGLIQFTTIGAKEAGTTLAALTNMDEIQQLDYVYNYFKRYRLRLNSYADLYRITFFPVSLGKPDDWVFQTTGMSAALIAKQNPAIDINKDGKITNAEFDTYLYKDFSQEVVAILKKKI